MKATLPQVQIDTEYVAFNGGYDVVTPPLNLKPGYVREAQNYEQDINGGYARILGYERYSGLAAPSDAAYAVLTVSITGSVAVGDVLTDNATTSFGTVVALPTGQAILTKITGTFSTGNIKVGGVVVGTCTGAQITDGASTPLLHAQYRNLAADVYRALITKPTGSGSILGVWVYNDTLYCWRNNAGGTAAVMFKATASGWSAVSLGRELAFTTGTAAVSEGQTLTGATSGATGVVTRIALRSGTYGGGTAAGSFIFATITGTFQNGENLQVGGVTKAVASGADAAITFAVPSGRFECVNANFGGSVQTKRMYGCDGKNRGFEFDGTVFVPIVTGMSPDTPTHVTVHKNQLFFSFGASVQHAAPGTPYVWSAVLGASEIALGDNVTNFSPQPGGETTGAMAITTRNSIFVLYGTGVSNWNLVNYKEEAGGYAYTLCRIGDSLMFDDRGITSLATAKEFGNFADATLSQRIQTWLKDKRALSVGALIVRDKNQYRLFFSDGSAVFVTMAGNRVIGMMPMLFPNPATCMCSAELSSGSEVAYFGSSDGHVYQLEKGTSFDGANIEAFLHLVFNPSKSPLVIKHYRGAFFEISGEGYSEFNFSYDLGYGATTQEQAGSETVTLSLSPSFWDSFVWDAFYWDGQTLIPQRAALSGDAENVSLKFRSISDYFAPHKISGALFQFTPRRRKR